MSMLATAAMWIALHLAGYFFVLRLIERLNDEKVIVIYHLSSWSLLCCGLIVTGFLRGFAELMTPSVAALSLHGIYSMIFWEIWGSSEGGFSLRIMNQVDRGRVTRDDLLEFFEKLGREKRSSRLADLQKMRLVTMRDQRYEVGVVGFVIVAIVRMLHLIGNVRESG